MPPASTAVEQGQAASKSHKAGNSSLKLVPYNQGASPERQMDVYNAQSLKDQLIDHLSVRERELTEVHRSIILNCIFGADKKILAKFRRTVTEKNFPLYKPSERRFSRVYREPIAFLDNTWGLFIRAGVMDQTHLQALDHDLFVAVRSWCTNRSLDQRNHLPIPRTVIRWLLPDQIDESFDDKVVRIGQEVAAAQPAPPAKPRRNAAASLHA